MLKLLRLSLKMGCWLLARDWFGRWLSYPRPGWHGFSVDQLSSTDPAGKQERLGQSFYNMVDYVADRIADESEIRSGKQFPYQYFAAYLNADDNVPQKIKTALHKAAEIACGNVPELPGPVMVGLDTSGSMSSAVTGNRG